MTKPIRNVLPLLVVFVAAVVLFCVLFCVFFAQSHTHSGLLNFQRAVLSDTVHDGLEPADLVNLGTIRVWGVDQDSVTTATLKAEGDGPEFSLPLQHFPDRKVGTHVRTRVCVCVCEHLGKKKNKNKLCLFVFPHSIST